MFRGFYTAASGMISQQRRQEMITNNVANINTAGYKADQVSLRSFPELLIQQMNSTNLPLKHGIRKNQSVPIGSLNTGVYAQELIPNFSQGMIRETGIETNIALIDGTYPDEMGTIFFSIENEQGNIRYTRNGNFTVDGEGYLTTNEGFYVLDDSGERIIVENENFILSSEGMIELDNANIPLGIVYIANPEDLVKEGNGLYNPDIENVQAADPTAVGATFSVQQGFLEGSNVDAQQAMTDMIQAYRSFEMNQRILKAFDESMERAVNDIARLG